MAVVRSLGTLQRGNWRDASPVLTPSYAVTPLGSLSYRSIYDTQPEVRVVVDFLARNIAQLGLHMFRRKADDDRQRDTAHPLIRLLHSPNPWTTRYRLIEATVIDTAVMGHAYWIKVRRREEGPIDAIVQVPAEQMAQIGRLIPEAYEYRPDDGRPPVRLARAQVVHFRHSGGTSPLESLKSVIAEARAAATSRVAFWKNGAKLGGYIQRPADAQPWSVEARERFRTQFRDKYTGAGNAGGYPVLEEGMSFHPVVSTMVDAEAVATWKLTREDVARAYHIPLPMVGLLDHATFSNIKEQHRHLYQDCLGPLLTMFSEDIELQLLRTDFDEDSDLYLEFNIQEKLRGSFEEQSAALQSSVGGPWMSRNEARARMNLPRLEGDQNDKVLAPLNMTTEARAPSTAVVPADEGVPA